MGLGFRNGAGKNEKKEAGEKRKKLKMEKVDREVEGIRREGIQNHKRFHFKI